MARETIFFYIQSGFGIQSPGSGRNLVHFDSDPESGFREYEFKGSEFFFLEPDQGGSKRCRFIGSGSTELVYYLWIRFIVVLLSLDPARYEVILHRIGQGEVIIPRILSILKRTRTNHP